MSDTQKLFIPDKIKVGYQDRADTYSGKLGFVIYYDEKGKLRKETSWRGWVIESLGTPDYSNAPMEGFVLNKKVGGVKESWGWNTRMEKVRVFDPRGFEIEITVPNLLFILREADCSRGKGLEGKFCYAWSGPELRLIPEGCEDYRQSKDYTKLQSKGVKAKEMIPGATYLTKRLEEWIYLGKLDYYFIVESKVKNGQDDEDYSRPTPEKDLSGHQKRHVFSDGKTFYVLDSLTKIGQLKVDTIDANYVSLLEKYQKSEHGSKITKFELRKMEKPLALGHHRTGYWFTEKEGVFTSHSTDAQHDHTRSTFTPRYVYTHSHYTIQDGVAQRISDYSVAYAPGIFPDRWNNYGQPYGRRQETKVVPYVEQTDQELWAILENGVEMEVDYSIFEKGHGHG